MIKIIVFGKFKDKEANFIADDYLKRIKKYHKIEIVELIEDNTDNVELNLKKEESKILQNISSKDYVVLLSPIGDKINSKGLSDLIVNSFNHNPNITFITGSSNGVSETIFLQSDQIISFSDLTFPHLLFRIMLLEQIYRSFKIANNERYHK